MLFGDTAVVDWMRANKLKLNTGKTEVLFVKKPVIQVMDDRAGWSCTSLKALVSKLEFYYVFFEMW